MPRYRLTITAQLTELSPVDLARLRMLVDSEIKQVTPDIVRIVLVRKGRDARCAAGRAFLDITRAVPVWKFARSPVWTARTVGLRGLGRRSSGRMDIGGDDDGLAGVREPRRPLPPHRSAAVALDLPAF